MTEEWRSIEGYEGLYEVSSYGRVKSVDRYVKYSDGRIYLHKGKILSPVKHKKGYLKVVLNCNGKCKTINIHRLVAQAFIENSDNFPQVNHKDEDKSNNRVDNLEWCDSKYNLNYGTARIRSRDTNIKNGFWTGLSKKEYRNKYYQENKDKICEKRKEYSQKYYQDNKDKIKDKARSYYQTHKTEYNERKKKYRAKKKIQNKQLLDYDC